MPWPTLNINIDPVALITLIQTLGATVNVDGSTTLPDGSVVDVDKTSIKRPDGIIQYDDGRVEVSGRANRMV